MVWNATKSDFETRDEVGDDEKLTAAEWNAHVSDQQRGKTSDRVDVAVSTVTLNVQESAWVNTTAAGGDVLPTLPANDDVADGQRVEVGVEEATHNTSVQANTGQSFIGTNANLTQAGDTATYEYKNDTSEWMVR